MRDARQLSVHHTDVDETTYHIGPDTYADGSFLSEGSPPSLFESSMQEKEELDALLRQYTTLSSFPSDCTIECELGAASEGTSASEASSESTFIADETLSSISPVSISSSDYMVESEFVARGTSINSASYTLVGDETQSPSFSESTLVENGAEPVPGPSLISSFEVEYVPVIRPTRRQSRTPQNWTCSYCSESFKRAYDRKRHERIHTNEKPYVCYGCKETYHRSDKRAKHWKRNPSCRALDEERVKGTEEAKKRRLKHSPF
ncbi:hypothetical protein DFH11DRAFT_1558477 [Phellopilus nigrolimitatus]|nr:hypothetical protein DFH11DRAFT_1558477 [Phellopilus nigrolimitatus]